jgi:hypothetical protein
MKQFYLGRVLLEDVLDKFVSHDNDWIASSLKFYCAWNGIAICNDIIVLVQPSMTTTVMHAAAV